MEYELTTILPTREEVILDYFFSVQSKTGLIYDPRYTESGVEVGFYISDFGLLTASAGNPRSSPFTPGSDLTYTADLKNFSKD